MDLYNIFWSISGELAICYKLVASIAFKWEGSLNYQAIEVIGETVGLEAIILLSPSFVLTLI